MSGRIAPRSEEAPVPPARRTIRASGFLFDLDGVLVDSTAVIERHWREFAERHGLDASELLAGVHGRRSLDVVRELGPRLRTTVEEALRAYEERDVADVAGTVALPGAARALAELPAGTWAVVTSATRAGAAARLAAAGLPVPAVLVTADDVPAGKPDPRPYQEGARRLELRPGVCLAVEDAPAGLRSATGAGCRTLALLTTHRRDELPPADAVVASLDDVELRHHT